MHWLYGDNAQGKQPLVQSQNPDLALLDDALRTKDGTLALERGLGLADAINAGKGDERLFDESLQSAREALPGHLAERNRSAE